MPRPRSEREIENARENARHEQTARLLALGAVTLVLGIAGLVVDLVDSVAPSDAWIILAVRGAGGAMTVVGAVIVLRAIGKLVGLSRADKGDPTPSDSSAPATSWHGDPGVHPGGASRGRAVGNPGV